MLTSGTLPKLRYFSSDFSDPDGLFWGMKTYLKARVRLQRKTISRNFLTKLLKNRVGTPEIESTAMRNIYGSEHRNVDNARNKQVEKEVMRILKLRIQVADRQIREHEQELNGANIRVKAIIGEEGQRWVSSGSENPSKWMESRLRDIEYDEMREQWADGKRWTSKRLEWLVGKFSTRRKNYRVLTDKGISVTRHEVEEFELKEGHTEENSFVVYGDVVLSEEEKDYLNLSPKFREFETLEVKKWHIEVETNAIKTRWELMSQDKSEKEKEGKSDQEIFEEKQKENESRKTYDEELGRINLSNYRVTDMPSVTRVFPPRPANSNQEMKIQEQCNLAREAFDEYVGKNCDENGNLKKNNLSVSQIIGKKRLRRKVKNGILVVTTTDKNGKFVVTTPEIYRYAANKHLSKDIEVGWDCVKERETFLNRHTAQLGKIFQMGGNHNQADRVNKALKSSDNPPPSVYFMFKDHKIREDGEPCPQTRQVCSAKEGILARLSHLASKILTPLADKLNQVLGTECSNTEEMMRGIQETNKKVLQRAENSSQRMDDLENLETSFISEDRELVVLSQDVKALYPSIKKEETIKIVGKLIEETEIEFDDVDYKCLGKYLAVHLTPEEIANNNLISVIPAMRKEKETQGVVRGRKPGIAYLDSDLDANKNEKWDWKGKRKNPTKIQKKKMIARTMEIIVDTIMSNHYYQFGGKVFKQVEGGPIGLEITGVLARLVMLWWDGKFLSKLGTLGIDLEFYLRYVDDSNMSAWALTPGTRFVDGQLSILKEFVGSDKLIPADKRTASVLRSIANEILPGIVMQEDVPSNHPNEKLPILDIEVFQKTGFITVSTRSQWPQNTFNGVKLFN